MHHSEITEQQDRLLAIINLRDDISYEAKCALMQGFIDLTKAYTVYLKSTDDQLREAMK